MKTRPESAAILGLLCLAAILAAAALQTVFGWRVPVREGSLPRNATAQALRGRRTLAALARTGMRATRSPVVINELMTLNPGDMLDERLTASDWVELYNRSDRPIPLRGCALSDSRSAARQWRFPDAVLPPRGYLTVWCSGRDEVHDPLRRVLDMVPTGDEPWKMKYDDRAPGGIAVEFDADADDARPYTVALNVPEEGRYELRLFAPGENAALQESPLTRPRPAGGAGLSPEGRGGNSGKPDLPLPSGENAKQADLPLPSGEREGVRGPAAHSSLRVTVDGAAPVSVAAGADGEYRWIAVPNPETADGAWPLAPGLRRIGLRAERGKIRVREVKCRNTEREGPRVFLHASFRLASSGESVILFGPDGAVLDYVTPPPMPPGLTYQRVPDGADVFQVARPSPEGGPALPSPAATGGRARAPHAPPGVAVLHINTDPANLEYTDLGIFNRRKKKGRDWERPADVRLFEGTNVYFDGRAGLRSHGWRHADPDQNSFHVNFRSCYGEDRLRRNLYDPDSAVRQRCVIADASGGGWADGIAYDVTRAIGGSAPRTRPALIFVNGRLYAPGTLVENVDDSFLLDRWGHADFDVIKRKPPRLKRGTWDANRRLHERLRDDEALQRMTAADVAPLLDVESLTAWMLGIILCDASEGGKHITREAFQGYFYADRRSPSPRIGLIAWDVDRSFRDVPYDTLRGILTRARFTTPVGAFRALLRNDPAYVRRFAEEAQHALNHVFREDRWRASVDRYAALYEEHAEDPAKWGEVFAMAQRVLRERPEIVRQQIAAHFALGEPHGVTVDGAEGARLLIDGCEESLPYRGRYFAGSRLTVEALPGDARRIAGFAVNGREVAGGRLAAAVAEDLAVETRLNP